MHDSFSEQVRWFADRTRMIRFAQINRDVIIAITNKLTWREGDGLEMLQEAHAQ